MRTARTVSTVMVLQLLWLIGGCCDEVHDFTYDWRGMSLVGLNNVGATPAESGSGPIPAAAFGVRARLENRMISEARSSVLPAALATSCAQILSYTNSDPLVAIRIDELPADPDGESRDVTGDFMALPPGSADNAARLLTLPALIDRTADRMPAPIETIDLLRIRNTGRADGVRFVVSFTLSGGRTLADTTEPVTLI